MKPTHGRWKIRTFFPLQEVPEAGENRSQGLCIPILQHDTFDMRYIVHGSLAQELLTVEEREQLWYDQFGLVPLRAHILPEMLLTDHI